MPANRLIFQDAIKARDAIANEQRREIKSLYSDWAEEIGAIAAAYNFLKSTDNDALLERQYRDLANSLITGSTRVSSKVEGIIIKNMRNMSNSVVNSNTKWLTSLGINSKAVNTDKIVQRLIEGKNYTSGWTLSKSIWGDNEQTRKQILEILAGGRSEGKSVYQMAKDIERFVNPDKRKPWNLRNAQGRLIYPRSVDYNAQRLARTMLQHSYQESLIETAKDNDLITGFRWVANGSRACELCLSRNGNIYAKDELPLDHPNGMCVFVPVVVDNWKEQLRDMLYGQ
jgi:SPP1 gp7 family putative phage head morphogenesis protein